MKAPVLMTAILLVWSPFAFGATASASDEEEAVCVARWWLEREIGGDWSRVPTQEKEIRLQLLEGPRVSALWPDGDTYRCGVIPQGETAAAYAVSFPAGGFVVVSCDDRVVPVLAFDARSPFAWDGDRGKTARVLLSRILASWRGAIAVREAVGRPLGVHAEWGVLRANLRKPTSPGSGKQGGYPGPGPRAVLIQLTTAAWNQGGFYNDTLQVNVGNDNSVPVGCTATAMAILMRYFEWPNTGTGSNSYWDVCNGVNYFHSVTLGATYTWSNMQITDLTTANADVADLMYDCAVMVGMDFEVTGSGAWPSATVMNTNFRYRGTTERTSSHETPIISCIEALVPVVLSSSAHTVVCDGYRDSVSPYYHINAGWSGASDGWYSLTTLPGGDPTIDRSYPYGTPSDHTYCDAGHTGTENGDLDTPYNTFGEGVTNVVSGGELWLKGGTYGGIGTYTQPMTLLAYDGNAVVQ